jgi:uncharacterized protein (DUF433 family)
MILHISFMILKKKQTVPLTKWEDGSIRVKGSRLPVDRIIYAHKQGEIPESIFESFPSESYTVADIYLIIAYYLTNKAKLDRYLAKREKEALKIRKDIESRPGYKEDSEKLRKKLLQRWQKMKEKDNLS